MNLIESRPDVMMGKPVVAGTRITVEGILNRLAAGETIEGIVEEHPRLTREAVLATANFHAAMLVTEDKDFDELVFRRSLVHQGVILLRFRIARGGKG